MLSSSREVLRQICFTSDVGWLYGKTNALYMDIYMDVLDALLEYVRFEQYSMTRGRV